MSENCIQEAITLDKFIGQTKAVDLLKTAIQSSKLRNETLGHILITGDRGSGKHTLSEAISLEMEMPVRSTSFYAVKTASDLAAVLTNIGESDILLIDNFELINKECIELLSSAMDEFSIDIVIGKGPSSRSIKLPLPQFTLIALSEDYEQIPKKIRSCFSIKVNFIEYTSNELVQLIFMNATQMNVKIDPKAAEILAEHARGSYRVITHSIKRARDFALIKNNGLISEDIATEVIDLMGSYD